MPRIRMSVIFRLALLVIFSDICSFQVRAIIRGFDAQTGQFPYQVAIRLRTRYLCGGGIIGERFVITAAHCVALPQGSFRDGPMRIVAGFTDVNDVDDGRRVEVDTDKVYVPNRYGGSNKNVADIAVIRTRQGFGLRANNLQALQLVTRRVDAESCAGELAVVAGIGVDEITSTHGQGNRITENGTKSGLLSWARAGLLDSDGCQRRGPNFVRDSHLCARMAQTGFSPYGICSGDSGGPLVHQSRTIIGVAIASPPACDESYIPGLYTRISAYLDFINDALNDTVREMRTKIYEDEATTMVPGVVWMGGTSCESTSVKYQEVTDNNL